MLRLYLGGQSSGKSAAALTRLLELDGPHALVATGRALDMGAASFSARIQAHKRERPAGIPVFEAGTDLAGALARAAAEHPAVLVEGLDFWLLACMTESQEGPESRIRELLDACRAFDRSDLILVSSETTLAPVAADPLTRAFVQRLGRLNQDLAGLADEVHLVMAGCALRLKGP